MRIINVLILLVFAAATTATAQPGGGKGGDPVQRAEMQTQLMIDSLSLSTKQGEKVKDINLKYANKIKEARAANTDGDWEKMRATMDAIRTEQNAELKTVLTQEQYDRWQKIAEAQMQRRGGPGGSSGGSPEDGDKGKGRKGKKGEQVPPPPPPPPAEGGQKQ